MRAYRWGYLEFVGPVATGLHLHHCCEQRDCVNPAHLAPVTCRENLMVSAITAASVNAAKTHCKRGHPFDEENTHIEAGRGGRQCKTCNRERTREYRARLKAAA